MRIILALLFVICMWIPGHAVTTDSIIITVQAVFNLSVNISSTSGTFGSAIPLGTSVTFLTSLVVNDGNVVAAWQKQSGNTINVSGAWTLDTTGAPGMDHFRLLAIPTGTGVSPAFTSGTSNRCLQGDHQGLLSVTNTSTELVENPAAAASPMHAVPETKSLWVSLMMPTNTTLGEEQTITMSVKAIAR